MTTESEVEPRPRQGRESGSTSGVVAAVREVRPNGARDEVAHGPSSSVATSELQEQNEEYWRSRTPAERQAYIQQLDDNYHGIVAELSKLEAASVVLFRDVHSRHMRFRRRTIWLTGFLAMANIVVSFTATQADDAEPGSWPRIVAVWLPVLVALYAAVIAIFSNLESLESLLQRAQVYRHTRETSLNTFRELEMMWHVYVRPFSDTPTACTNATSLYRRAVTRDREVRSQLMERPAGGKDGS